MTILEKVSAIIDELKQNSQEEINRINSILNVVTSSIEALENEEILKDYDFSIAINLVNSKSFGLLDLEKIIGEVKNILIAKYDYQQSFLTLNDDYKRAIKGFRERLCYLKEEYEKRIEIKSQVKIDEKTLENLEDLKRLLEGKGRRKYYTYDMLEALFEVFDYDSFSPSEMEELIKELSISKNMKGKLLEEEKDIDEVVSVFKEFLGNKVEEGFFKKYQHEICARIDIANARSILKFFKDNNLFDRFGLLSVMTIAIYGRYDYVNSFYFEKVLPKDEKIQELYFQDAMNGVWINENSSKRRRGSSIRKKGNKENGVSLYSSISDVCDDDVWENIRLLKENESLLSEKYDLSNIDWTWVITKPVWLIKKNIDLFKLFNITDVKITALVQSDLEDKIHFAIELGLLNTPRTYVFREIEKTVPRYHEFMLNGKRKRHNNDNILNYFSRNTSEIGKTTYTEYIYWFYKMQRSSKEEFYADFFSGMKAGRRNKTDVDLEGTTLTENNETFERMVANNFVTYYYDALIPDYDTYSEVIRDYKDSEVGDIVNPYYDKDILNDELVQSLEKRMAIDIYNTDGEIRKVYNPYVYVFDTNIISRLKVLRNLSILKHKYGYLNEDMILTATVYNSYINKDVFDLIRKTIREGMISK